MLKLLEKTSKRSNLIILTILSASCYAGVIYFMSSISKVSGGRGVLDFEFGYTPEFVHQLFMEYGERGIALYQSLLTIDLLNPLLYSLVLASLIYIFYKNTNYQFLYILAFLTALFDYLENIFLWQMSTQFPDISAIVINTGNYLSIIKRIVMIVTIIAFWVGLVRWKMKKTKK